MRTGGWKFVIAGQKLNTVVLKVAVAVAVAEAKSVPTGSGSKLRKPRRCHQQQGLYEQQEFLQTDMSNREAV